MKLYHFPSPNPQKVTFALLELGLDCEKIPVDLSKQEQRAPAFLAVNPAGRVPVLVDGDVILTESHAILAYLGETAGRLWPATAAGAALTRSSRAGGDRQRRCTRAPPLYDHRRGTESVPAVDRARPRRSPITRPIPAGGLFLRGARTGDLRAVCPPGARETRAAAGELRAGRRRDGAGRPASGARAALCDYVQQDTARMAGFAAVEVAHDGSAFLVSHHPAGVPARRVVLPSIIAGRHTFRNRARPVATGLHVFRGPTATVL